MINISLLRVQSPFFATFIHLKIFNLLSTYIRYDEMKIYLVKFIYNRKLNMNVKFGGFEFSL